VAPSAGRFWKVEVRRDVGAVPPLFPGNDDAQAAMDRALLPRASWGGDGKEQGQDGDPMGRMTHSIGPMVLRLQPAEHVLHAGAHRQGRLVEGGQESIMGPGGSIELQAGQAGPRQLQIEWRKGGTVGRDTYAGGRSQDFAPTTVAMDHTARSADPRSGYIGEDGHMSRMRGLRMLVPPLDDPGREGRGGAEILRGAGSRPVSRSLSVFRRGELRADSAGWVRPPVTQAAMLAHALSGRLGAGLGHVGTVPGQ